MIANNLVVGIVNPSPRSVAMGRVLATHGCAVHILDAGAPIGPDRPETADDFVRHASLRDLVAGLPLPRTVLLHDDDPNRADEILGAIAPLLESGDVVVDLCDGWFEDFERRSTMLAQPRARFIAAGILCQSNRFDNSLMFMGGHQVAFGGLSKIFGPPGESSISVLYVGNGGAGHLVRAAVAALQVAELTASAEVTDLFGGPGIKPSELFPDHALQGVHRSSILSEFLELQAADPVSRQSRTRCCGQTGMTNAGGVLDERFTCTLATRFGVAAPSFAASLDARHTASLKELREANSGRYPRPVTNPAADPSSVKTANAGDSARQTILAFRIICLTQLFSLLRAASQQFEFGIPLVDIAKALTQSPQSTLGAAEPFVAALADDKSAANLLSYPRIQYVLTPLVPALRRSVALAIEKGRAVPVLNSALTYFDAVTSSTSSVELLQ